MGEDNRVPYDVIFSLDIGTRNVVGILGKMEGEVFKIIDYEILEHPDRAMYDGQIHDIDKVSKVVEKVKERLEERAGFELKYVSIAAAGRALKTQRVLVENEIDRTREIDKTIIDNLEIQGIQMAQKELEISNSDEKTKYYCVGYTVINYYLDNSIIGNLKGHRGSKIGVDILATFLPHVVVDSLYSVVHKVGLEVINLTLEPIAAINVAIPPKFRLLNLALVDIGAGTSDIAITKEGTIVSYAMASVAGDEITEALSKAYLLDFDTAEKLKIQLNKRDVHSFTDIVGINYNLETNEIVDKIKDSIKELSEEIANKIIEYNGKSPSAVFCIGGGSQIPGLTEYLAQSLRLPGERVVIKGTDILEKVEFLCDKLIEPEYITPIGIGYTAFKDKEHDFLNVTVDGKPIRLFNSKSLSVSDALILVGYNARKLLAVKGKALSFILNGKKETVYGDYGEPAKIYVNGTLGSLDTKLKNKDSIVIEPATRGKDAKAFLGDVINFDEKIIFNGKEIGLINNVYINGSIANENYEIMDDDEIYIDKLDNVEELLHKFGIDKRRCKVLANNKTVDMNYKIKNGDVILIEEVNDTYNGAEGGKREFEKTDFKKDHIEVIVNGERVKIENKDKEMIFVDIFNYINFDLTNPKGLLELKLNGKRANYTDKLNHNDNIEIYWK